MLRCPGEQLGVRSRRLTRREATMGLDARVRCRCFEDGRLKPGPVPVTDLYIDEDGYLASRTLDTASIRYDWRRYHARYGKLDEEFTLWLEDCCKHENGEYCSEWIGTWGMYGVFQDAVEKAGGKEVLPLLGHMLPTANGGQYPVEKTEATLVEVEQFIRITRDECARGMACSLRRLLLASLETRNPILWC